MTKGLEESTPPTHKIAPNTRLDSVQLNVLETELVNPLDSAIVLTASLAKHAAFGRGAEGSTFAAGMALVHVDRHALAIQDFLARTAQSNRRPPSAPTTALGTVFVGRLGTVLEYVSVYRRTKGSRAASMKALLAKITVLEEDFVIFLRVVIALLAHPRRIVPESTQNAVVGTEYAFQASVNAKGHTQVCSVMCTILHLTVSVLHYNFVLGEVYATKMSKDQCVPALSDFLVKNANFWMWITPRFARTTAVGTASAYYPAIRTANANPDGSAVIVQHQNVRPVMMVCVVVMGFVRVVLACATWDGKGASAAVVTTVCAQVIALDMEFVCLAEHVCVRKVGQGLIVQSTKLVSSVQLL